MTAATHFDSWVTYNLEVMYNGATPPNPSNFYAILCNSSTWDRAASIATVVGTEVAATNGYARQGYNPGATVYSTTNKRGELPSVAPTGTATGAIMWDAIVILADATATRGDTTGRLVSFLKLSSPQSLSAGEPLIPAIRGIAANVGFILGT